MGRGPWAEAPGPKPLGRSSWAEAPGPRPLGRDRATGGTGIASKDARNGAMNCHEKGPSFVTVQKAIFAPSSRNFQGFIFRKKTCMQRFKGFWPPSPKMHENRRKLSHSNFHQNFTKTPTGSGSKIAIFKCDREGTLSKFLSKYGRQMEQRRERFMVAR